VPAPIDNLSESAAEKVNVYFVLGRKIDRPGNRPSEILVDLAAERRWKADATHGEDVGGGGGFLDG